MSTTLREALIWSGVRELLRAGHNPATAKLAAATVLDAVEAVIRADERAAANMGFDKAPPEVPKAK